MLIKDFITKELPVLKKTDTVEYALGLMDDFKLRHLPLLNGEFYGSLISEKELMEITDLNSSLENIEGSSLAINVDADLHEVLSIMSRYNLSLLPVISSDKEYIGALTRDKLFDLLSDLCSAEETGSVCVLELMPQDYSLTEIARIIESNNAHVLNLLSYNDSVTGRLQLIIKIDLEDASPVIRSFERFNYDVLYYFMEKGLVDDVLQRRMEELQVYMNV